MAQEGFRQKNIFFLSTLLSIMSWHQVRLGAKRAHLPIAAETQESVYYKDASLNHFYIIGLSATCTRVGVPVNLIDGSLLFHSNF